jgi:hypothetical protein
VAEMKNIQIIDGAKNSIFEVYGITEELFDIMFPSNTDIAFLDDLEQIFAKVGDDQIMQMLYGRPVNKKELSGIHGTLHLTGSNCDASYYPSRKETEVLNR